MDQKMIAFVIIAFIVGAAIGYFYATNYAAPSSGQQVLARGAARASTGGGGVSCPGKSCAGLNDCQGVSGTNATCSGICNIQYPATTGTCSWTALSGTI